MHTELTFCKLDIPIWHVELSNNAIIIINSAKLVRAAASLQHHDHSEPHTSILPQQSILTLGSLHSWSNHPFLGHPRRCLSSRPGAWDPTEESTWYLRAWSEETSLASWVMCYFNDVKYSVYGNVRILLIHVNTV